ARERARPDGRVVPHGVGSKELHHQINVATTRGVHQPSSLLHQIRARGLLGHHPPSIAPAGPRSRDAFNSRGPTATGTIRPSTHRVANFRPPFACTSVRPTNCTSIHPNRPSAPSVESRLMTTTLLEKHGGARVALCSDGLSLRDACEARGIA